MAADAAVFFGLWLLPESFSAAPRRSSALARGLVRAGCPLERIHTERHMDNSRFRKATVCSTGVKLYEGD